MKKIVGAGFAMLMAVAAVHGDEYDSAKEKSSLSDGLYFLFGFGMSSVENGVDAASDISSDENVPEDMVISNIAGNPLFERIGGITDARNAGYEIVRATPRDGDPDLFKALTLRRRSSCSGRDSKLSGVAGIGIGGNLKNLCDNLYLSVETLLDVGSPNRTSHDGRLPGTDGAMPYYISSSGATFSLALRLGYEFVDGTRFYLKAGGALIRSEAGHSGLGGLKMSKITPLVAIGVEQHLQGAFSTRLELERRFVAKKDGHLPFSQGDYVVFDDVVIPDLAGTRFRKDSSDLRQKTKSWEARLVFQYTTDWLKF